MRRITAVLIAASLLFAGCSGGDDASGVERSGPVTTADPVPGTSLLDEPAVVTSVAPDRPQAEPREGWTFLVYSMADTDLEPFLLEDIREMAEVGSGPGVEIFALVDRAEEYSDESLLGIDNWHGAKLLHIQQNSAVEIADLGVVNSGDPQLLADFITTGISEFPADNYALVISDHGAAWPGVGGDESFDHDVLDLAEVTAGIAAGLEGAGVDKLDLLGFDACLMASYEVARTLAPLANRMLASQELEPGHGWDYRALQILNDDPSTDVDGLSRAIVDGFAAQAREQGTDVDITLSLVDLTKMAALDEALDAFTAVLAERAAPLGRQIGTTRATTLAFGRSPDPQQDTHMIDMGNLVAQIGIDALDISDEADAVLRAINQAVVYSVSGPATRGATGLSIYFPPQERWFDTDYTAVGAVAGWNDFLTAYYSAGAAIPDDQKPQFTTDDAEVFFDEDGLNIVGVFDLAAQDNLSTAVIEYGIINDDGSVTFLGSEPAAISDDGSGVVLGIYDLTVLTIDDGFDTVYAYLDLTFDEETGFGTVDVPMEYYPPGSDQSRQVLLSLVFDADTGDVVSEVYYSYNPDTGTYGELTADPEGLMVPLFLQVLADGSSDWLPLEGVGVYADLPELGYDLEPLEAGTELYVELTVIDFGGNSASVSATVVVP